MAAGKQVIFTVGSTALNAATLLGLPPGVIATSVFVQMISGTGIGYVYENIPSGVIPSGTTSGQLTAEIAAAGDVTSPGGSYGDPDLEVPGQRIELDKFWVSGATTSDTGILRARIC